MTTNTTRRITAAASSPRMSALPQPSALPRIRANTRAKSAPEKLLRQERQRGREHRGAPNPLEAAREVEHGGVTRETAEERGEAEEADAGHEGAPAPEAVGQRPGGQEKAGERQRVGVDHPLK